MYYDDDFRPYVPVGERRARAQLEVARLKKKGRQTSPVTINGRKIATTFWGGAWCENLERYSDFANRLPRGRTYVRNGSVVDLQVEPGSVSALVCGTEMYSVTVTVGPVAPARWSAICEDCSGAIDSLVELLQGRLSKGVMTRLCDGQTGLFPGPKDILFTCSCPDWASMCKHVAAVLYGIGARLDHQPELLFTLRKVDQRNLIAQAGAGLSKKGKGPASARVLASDDLSEMFGIEMAPATPPEPAASDMRAARRSAGSLSKKRKDPTSAQVLGSEDVSERFGIETASAKPAASNTRPSRRAVGGHAADASRPAQVTGRAAVKAPIGRPELSPLAPAKRSATVKEPQGKRPVPRTAANREAISARMREYWAARRGGRGKTSL